MFANLENIDICCELPVETPVRPLINIQELDIVFLDGPKTVNANCEMESNLFFGAEDMNAIILNSQPVLTVNENEQEQSEENRNDQDQSEENKNEQEQSEENKNEQDQRDKPAMSCTHTYSTTDASSSTCITSDNEKESSENEPNKSMSVTDLSFSSESGEESTNKKKKKRTDDMLKEKSEEFMEIKIKYLKEKQEENHKKNLRRK
ncbi:glutamic acid-rich protein-like [Anoplophora glabripennis]|uniref:glutamic acid-rich protein-like n=1 Tax=Anoplophora glabripennis TaxID=217634 RepID=UPI000C789FB5|nr:glutamic acid-rich protein-like [Anoplophora glabripennis]